MKIAIVGRTKFLLDAAYKLNAAGFQVPLIITCKPESFYRCDLDAYRKVAQELGSDLVVSQDINNREILEIIKEKQCRVAFSFNWISLIKNDIREAFKEGIFNIHPGDLPRYRGNACPNWAIIQNEECIGLTLYQMDGGLDTGRIAAKEFLPIDEKLYIQDVYEWLGHKIPEMFLELAQKIQNNEVILTEQLSGKSVLRCYPRKPEDSKISWSSEAKSIVRLIRASSYPFDGAYASFEDKKLIIWRAETYPLLDEFLAIPGQIMMKDVVTGNPVIATGDGAIRLDEISFEELSSEEAKLYITRSLRNRLY